MNPRHYQRGWHCTSTLGTIGAAAAAARLLGLDAAATGHALAIAASEASGLKENFGTMVKPLHAGLAARNGVVAALLAQAGMTGERRGDRRSAGISGGVRQRAAVARAVCRRSRRALGNRRDRHHREAVSVLRRHPSDARRAARSQAARRASAPTRSRRSRSGSIRSCRRSCSTIGRRAGWKASSACRSAPPPRWCAAASASRRSTPRRCAIRRSLALQARVDDARRSRAGCVGAVADPGAGDRAAARRPRADARRPTARAAIPSAPPATRSWRRSSPRARRRRCRLPGCRGARRSCAASNRSRIFG